MNPKSDSSSTLTAGLPAEGADTGSLTDFAAATAPLPRPSPAAVEASPEALADAIPTVASRRELLLGLLGISAIAIMVAFDSTIVSTTLPRIADALDGMLLYA